MALSCHVGTFALNTSTGNQAITGLGFQPEVLIFYSVIVTGDGLSTGGAAYKLYFGGAVSSSSRFAVGNVCNDNVSSGSHHSRQDNTKCMTSLVNAGTVFTAADFVSMNADGFTINVTTANASSRKWHYIALGGTDLTNVAIKEFQNQVGLGADAVTGVGFQGDCFLFFSTNDNGTPPSQETAPELMIGMATANGDQAVIGSNVGAVLRATSVFRTDRCLAFLNGSDAMVDDAIFSSADSDGFTLNWQDATNPDAVYWAICLKGGYYKLATFESKATTGDQELSGFGLTPTGAILMSNNAAASGIQTGHSRISFGAASGASAQAAIWSGKTDNTNPTACDNSEQSDHLITMATEGTPTVDAEGALSSFNSNGMTINWPTYAASRQVVYLAFGHIAASEEDDLIAAMQTTINSGIAAQQPHLHHFSVVGH